MHCHDLGGVAGQCHLPIRARPEPRNVNFFGNRVLAGVNPMAQQLPRREGIYLQRMAGANLSLALRPTQNRQVFRSLGLKVNEPTDPLLPVWAATQGSSTPAKRIC